MNKNFLLRIAAVAIIAPILFYTMSYPISWLALNDARGNFNLERLMRWLNPTLCLYIAVMLAAGWIVTALLSRSRPSHVFMGLATIICFWLYHIAALYKPLCEINVRQVALRSIDESLKAGNLSEVRRAIRIHDEEFNTTKDALFAAQALLHELNRAFD